MSLILEIRASFNLLGKGRLTEIYLNFLGTRFVRDENLFWHFASFCFWFLFYQFRVAARNLALRARGLITNSWGVAMMGFLLIILSSDSSPRFEAFLK